MSVTSGFFNSLNGDRRYNAEQMSALFDTIINDGVFANVGTAFEVNSVGGMKISVGIGRAWFNSTWLYNDALLPLTLDASEVLLNRYDAVVLEINHTEMVRAGSIKIVKGTPSSNPLKPTMTSESEVHQYPLAYIYISANTTEITQANITNMIGTSDCPYITGILQVQNIDKIVAQWMAEWEQLVDARDAEFNAWFSAIKASLDEDAATQLANKILSIENGETSVGNALKLNGLSTEEFVVNENLLINPELEIGATTIANKSGGTTAVASKWSVSAHSNITYSAEHTENGLKITSQNGTDGGWLNLGQVHTDFVLEDGIYTLSFYCDKPENIRQCGFTSSHATVTGGGYWFNKNGNIISVTSKLLNVTGVSVFIQLLNEACDVTIKWLKLERGSVATPFIPPNKEVEKLKCGIVSDSILRIATASDTIAEVLQSLIESGIKQGKIQASGCSDLPSTDWLYGVEFKIFNGDDYEVTAVKRLRGVYRRQYSSYQKTWLTEWSNSADGGNADTVDGKHSHEFVQYLGEIKDSSIVKDANYAGAPYEGILTDTIAEELGLPKTYWHIKFYRHIHNNGHGFQEVKPLSSSTEVPRYRGSSGTAWRAWETGFVPLNGGGTIKGRVDVKTAVVEVLGVINTSDEPVTIGFTGASGKKGSFGFMNADNPAFWKSDGTTLGYAIHTGNIASHALPLTGGTIKGSLAFTTDNQNTPPTITGLYGLGTNVLTVNQVVITGMEANLPVVRKTAPTSNNTVLWVVPSS